MTITMFTSGMPGNDPANRLRTALAWVCVFAGLNTAPALAVGLFDCLTCGPCGGAAHQPTPYGDTGCGPRYWGAVHDDPCGVDPCDCCNRWRGCNGAAQISDMLAPWQLPPCRGFQNAAEIGYAGNGGGGACTDCSRPWYQLW